MSLLQGLNSYHFYADLATTSETEPPPIESEKTPDPMQMSVTAEGSTVPVPDEEREYTLSLMKQPSADGKCVDCLTQL